MAQLPARPATDPEGVLADAATAAATEAATEAAKDATATATEAAKDAAATATDAAKAAAGTRSEAVVVPAGATVADLDGVGAHVRHRAQRVDAGHRLDLERLRVEDHPLLTGFDGHGQHQHRGDRRGRHQALPGRRRHPAVDPTGDPARGRAGS